MGVKFTREVDRFSARSDDGDYEVTIVVTQDFIDAGTRANPHAVVPGRLKEARTTDGLACNFVDENTFEVVNDPYNPGVVVKRRD